MVNILFLSCLQYTKYLPRPEEEVKNWVENFFHQKSFAYIYELKTRLVHINGKGKCIIGYGEDIRGIWESPESSYTFAYIGINDLEWTKIDREWKESARGEESDIFAQIKRMLEFDKFEYIGLKDNFYTYQFKANVPFLDPMRWREMIGFLMISKKNFLPAIIWAGLPDSSVYWYVRISNINKKKKITPPTIKSLDYKLIWDTTAIPISEAFKKIKTRLDLLDLQYRIEKRERAIILRMPSYYQIEDIREALTPGDFACYAVADNESGMERVVYLNEDPKKPLSISGKLFNSDDIKECEIGFDHQQKPYLTIKLKRRIDLPAKIAYELGGICIGITTLDIPKKLDKIIFYPEMAYLKMLRLKGIICEPLFPVDVKPVAERSE